MTDLGAARVRGAACLALEVGLAALAVWHFGSADRAPQLPVAVAECSPTDPQGARLDAIRYANDVVSTIDDSSSGSVEPEAPWYHHWFQAPSAAVKVRVANTSGGLERAIVRRYLKHAVAKLDACFARTDPVEPAVRELWRFGTSIGLQLEIAPGGGVQAWWVVDIGEDQDATEGCVISAIQTIAFPASETPTEANVILAYVPQLPIDRDPPPRNLSGAFD